MHTHARAGRERVHVRRLHVPDERTNAHPSRRAEDRDGPRLLVALMCVLVPRACVREIHGALSAAPPRLSEICATPDTAGLILPMRRATARRQTAATTSRAPLLPRRSLRVERSPSSGSSRRLTRATARCTSVTTMRRTRPSGGTSCLIWLAALTKRCLPRASTASTRRRTTGAPCRCRTGSPSVTTACFGGNGSPHNRRSTLSSTQRALTSPSSPRTRTRPSTPSRRLSPSRAPPISPPIARRTASRTTASTAPRTLSARRSRLPTAMP